MSRLVRLLDVISACVSLRSSRCLSLSLADLESQPRKPGRDSARLSAEWIRSVSTNCENTGGGPQRKKKRRSPRGKSGKSEIAVCKVKIPSTLTRTFDFVRRLRRTSRDDFTSTVLLSQSWQPVQAAQWQSHTLLLQCRCSTAPDNFEVRSNTSNIVRYKNNSRRPSGKISKGVRDAGDPTQRYKIPF